MEVFLQLITLLSKIDFSIVFFIMFALLVREVECYKNTVK